MRAFLILACILFIKLARATDRARELSWARACALVRDCARPIESPDLIYIFVHICTALFDLHLLPVKQRIYIRIILLTYKCIMGKVLVYLRDMVERYMPKTALRSIDPLLL